MSVLGFLLLSTIALSAPAEGPTVGAPRLMRGDELSFIGYVEEAGEAVGNRFRKRYELEIRVLVLESSQASADCAVMTRLRPLADPLVAESAATITGADLLRQPAPAAVRVDLVRVDLRGRATLLTPRPGALQLQLGPETPVKSTTPLPLDTAPTLELGMFVVLPPKPATLGSSWAMDEPGRPPVVGTARCEAVWNGGRCLEVSVSQQSDGWDKPALVLRGWKRTDTILTSPGDGVACSVSRRIERREGGNVVGWVETRFEVKPVERHLGSRFADVRRDAETAYAFASEFESLVARTKAIDRDECRARIARIDRFVLDHPFRTSFREAIESVRRRYESAARGDVATTAGYRPVAREEKPDRLGIGRPAPDFVAANLTALDSFHLAAARGRPVVLLFFKPGSKTSVGALQVAEALHRVFDGRATIAAVAIADTTDRQYDEMKLTHPHLDGTKLKALYGIDTHPKFFVVDAEGLIAWQFDGFGAETGYLVKKEVERLLK